jgi:hypothetical protein
VPSLASKVHSPPDLILSSDHQADSIICSNQPMVKCAEKEIHTMSITSPPYKLQKGIDSSAGSYESSFPTSPSTSWIPLEGLAQQ